MNSFVPRSDNNNDDTYKIITIYAKVTITESVKMFVMCIKLLFKVHIIDFREQVLM